MLSGATWLNEPPTFSSSMLCGLLRVVAVKDDKESVSLVSSWPSPPPAAPPSLSVSRTADSKFARLPGGSMACCELLRSCAGSPSALPEFDGVSASEPLSGVRSREACRWTCSRCSTSRTSLFLPEPPLRSRECALRSANAVCSCGGASAASAVSQLLLALAGAFTRAQDNTAPSPDAAPMPVAPANGLLALGAAPDLSEPCSTLAGLSESLPSEEDSQRSTLSSGCCTGMRPTSAPSSFELGWSDVAVAAGAGAGAGAGGGCALADGACAALEPKGRCAGGGGSGWTGGGGGADAASGCTAAATATGTPLADAASLAATCRSTESRCYGKRV